MQINGNLTFLGGGIAESLRLESLAVDPTVPMDQQVWINGTDAKIRAKVGGAVITLSNAGDTQAVKDELDAAETALGLEADGTLAAFTAANYIAAATTLRAATVTLDGQAKINETAAAAAQTAADAAQSDVDDAQAELDLAETSIGLEADGTLAAFTAANYIASNVTLRAATVTLDGQAKINADNIALKFDIAGGTITGATTVNADITMGATNKIVISQSPTGVNDAVNKNYVDAKIQGLTWRPPVKEIVVDHTAVVGMTEGYRVINTTDGKVYTYAGSAWDTGATPEANWAVFVEISDEGFTYDLGTTTWVKFSSTTLVQDGAGLYKDGNVINIGASDGITVNADDIAVNLATDKGLEFLTGQLAVNADDDTIETATGGIRIKALGVKAAALNTDVIGNGLQGANGAAIVVKADTGITVTAAGVGVDTTWVDARFINVDGDTMTGMLTLSAAPTVDLHAATKKYVDELSARMDAGYMVYTGSTAAVSHTVTHNMGVKFVSVTVIDVNDKVILPQSITYDSTTALTVAFNTSLACKVLVSGLKTV